MSKSEAKPNIIFILSDQQRWDTLGCYGQKLPVSPVLDKLALEGVRFEHAFTPQPLCGPARACLQTGKYATQTGNFRNHIALPQSEQTIAHFLSNAGYEVAYIGKWHLASTSMLGDADIDFRMKPVPQEYRGGYKGFWLAADVLEFTSHGYDGHLYNADMEKVEFKGYRADCLTNFAIEYLRMRKPDKPFFLFLSYVEPHQQNDRNCFEAPEGSRQRFTAFTPPGDLIDYGGDWQEHFPDYLGCCESIDYNVGRIREELIKSGLDSNTIIVYTSDHGCHFKTRNDEYKRSCHESSIRIPLIICGPGFVGGKVFDNLVSLIDVFPTLLNLAGIEKPDYIPGKPLQQLISADSDWPDEVFIQISEAQLGRAIRTKRWKYSVCAPNKDPVMDSGSDVYVEDFLYDLQTDPHEKNNLVKEPDYINVRRELAEKLKFYVDSVEKMSVSILPK